MQIKRIESLEKFKQLFHQVELGADISYFQSWGWVESGLNLFDEESVLLVAMVDDEAVGVAPFFINHIKRNQFISSTALYLNEVENSRYYMFVEYNGFIVKRGLESEVADAFLEYLMNSDIKFDEIMINRVLSDNPLFNSASIKNCRLNLFYTDDWVTRYVDLKKVRESPQGYISILNKNNRSKLRRSLKKYRELGEVTLHCADDVNKALRYFRELGERHQKYWIAKGHPGSFAEKGWVKFHESIITQRFEFSEIQLLKISVGNDVIGYIYNLVRNGHIYSIQAVFNYLPDKAFRPGYVCDYLAIEYNSKQGADTYDFLASESSYYTSLSNGYDILRSIVLQKNKFKFKIERLWLGVKFYLKLLFKSVIQK